MELRDVKKGYSGLAKIYDKLFNLCSGKILGLEKYRREAVGWLGLKKGDTVIDIGCGRGVNFPFLYEKIGREGRIIGLDYTEAMLDEAREKIDKMGWKNITLIHGDAVRVDEFIDTKVDAAISTYCFTLLYDYERALLNAIKVLKPGGRIIILDVKRTRPGNGLVRLIYPVYIAIARGCNIASDDDLDERNVIKKWESWQEIVKIRLDNLRQRRFFFGIFFTLRGDKKRAE